MTNTAHLDLDPTAAEAEVLLGSTEELAILLPPGVPFDMSFDAASDPVVAIAHIDGRNRLLTTSKGGDGPVPLSHIANLPDDARGIFQSERSVVLAEVDTLRSQVRDIGAARSVPLRWNNRRPT